MHDSHAIFRGHGGDRQHDGGSVHAFPVRKVAPWSREGRGTRREKKSQEKKKRKKIKEKWKKRGCKEIKAVKEEWCGTEDIQPRRYAT